MIDPDNTKYLFFHMGERVNTCPHMIYMFESSKITETDIKQFFDELLDENWKLYWNKNDIGKLNLLYVRLLEFLDEKLETNALDSLIISTPDTTNIDNDPLLGHIIINGQSEGKVVYYRIFNGGVTKHYPNNPVLNNHIPIADYEAEYSYVNGNGAENQKLILYHYMWRLKHIEFGEGTTLYTPYDIADILGIDLVEMARNTSIFEIQNGLEERGFNVTLRDTKNDKFWM